MSAKPSLIAALLSFLVIAPAIGGDGEHQDHILFKDANGVPMGVERQGAGFLLAYAGNFYTVTESSSFDFTDEHNTNWLADWSNGRLELSINGSIAAPRPADSFRFVDWEGKVWQATADGGEFIIKPLPALAPVSHVQCIKVLGWCGGPHWSCWAPNGKIRAVLPDDEIVHFVDEFSYLDWDNHPRTAAWFGNRFMVGAEGGGPRVPGDSLRFLDWDGKKRIAAWDAAANQFVISVP